MKSIIISFFIIAYIIIAENSYIFNISNKIFHEKCLSLVIPATLYSWRKCHYQIETMICNSKDVPNEIIVVISGNINNSRVIYTTNCTRLIYLYYRKELRNSASNKNYGSKFSKCDYISFFDSDDIMSPFRIRVLNYIINHFPEYDLILHMYTKNYSQLVKNNNSILNLMKYFYLNSSYITLLYKKNIKFHKIELWGCCHFLPIHYHISNGWITVKRSMFLLEKFNEDMSIQRAEDSEYNGRVISKGYKALILKMILGLYSKQNECNKYSTNS